MTSNPKEIDLYCTENIEDVLYPKPKPIPQSGAKKRKISIVDQNPVITDEEKAKLNDSFIKLLTPSANTNKMIRAELIALNDKLNHEISQLRQEKLKLTQENDTYKGIVEKFENKEEKEHITKLVDDLYLLRIRCALDELRAKSFLKKLIKYRNLYLDSKKLVGKYTEIISVQKGLVEKATNTIAVLNKNFVAVKSNYKRAFTMMKEKNNAKINEIMNMYKQKCEELDMIDQVPPVCLETPEEEFERFSREVLGIENHIFEDMPDYSVQQNIINNQIVEADKDNHRLDLMEADNFRNEDLYGSAYDDLLEEQIWWDYTH